MTKSIAAILLISSLFLSTAFAVENDEVSLTNETSNAMHRLKEEGIDLVSQPVQSRNILKTLGVISATSLTFLFDKDISKTFEKNESLNKAAAVGSLIGNPFLHLGLAAGVYGAGIAADSLKWKETGEMMGEALILSDASTFILKETIGRGRPNRTTSTSDFKPFEFRKDYDSFPSMHTSSSFALASVMSATTESLTLKTLLYSAAAFVGLSRMQETKHWASDVLFGAVLGEVCGRVVTYYHVTGNKLALAPMANWNGAGLALVGKW